MRKPFASAGLIAGLLLIAIAGPLHAQPTPPPPPEAAVPPPAQAPPAADPNAKADGEEQLICKREAVTGSRLAKRRVCLTRAQWAEASALTRETVRDSLARSNRGRQPQGN